jgi:hypothetical protein
MLLSLFTAKHRHRSGWPTRRVTLNSALTPFVASGYQSCRLSVRLDISCLFAALHDTLGPSAVRRLCRLVAGQGDPSFHCLTCHLKQKLASCHHTTSRFMVQGATGRDEVMNSSRKEDAHCLRHENSDGERSGDRRRIERERERARSFCAGVPAELVRQTSFRLWIKRHRRSKIVHLPFVTRQFPVFRSLHFFAQLQSLTSDTFFSKSSHAFSSKCLWEICSESSFHFFILIHFDSF